KRSGVKPLQGQRRAAVGVNRPWSLVRIRDLLDQDFRRADRAAGSPGLRFTRLHELHDTLGIRKPTPPRTDHAVAAEAVSGSKPGETDAVRPRIEADNHEALLRG